MNTVKNICCCNGIMNSKRFTSNGETFQWERNGSERVKSNASPLTPWGCLDFSFGDGSLYLVPEETTSAWNSTCLVMPRPRRHYAGEIWKRKRVKCFPSTLRRRSLKCNDRSCAWGKLWLGNHMIVLMSSFSKSFVFKIFSVHTKTKTRRFQISPVWRAFSKCSRPLSWQISVDCRLNRRIKDAFSNFSNTVCGA